MAYYNQTHYITKREKRLRTQNAYEVLRENHIEPNPVIIEDGQVEKTWWGQAWQKSLRRYTTYKNRLEKGKQYVLNQWVIHMTIVTGQVNALVQGTEIEPYTVTIEIEPLKANQWDHIVQLCHHRVASLDALALGLFPEDLPQILTTPEYGLFPSPEAIVYTCSCKDKAPLCKHIAAVLYGIGARFDQEPLLFFELRGVDGKALIQEAMDSQFQQLLERAQQKSHRALTTDEIQDVFHIKTK